MASWSRSETGSRRFGGRFFAGPPLDEIKKGSENQMKKVTIKEIKLTSGEVWISLVYGYKYRINGESIQPTFNTQWHTCNGPVEKVEELVSQSDINHIPPILGDNY